MTEEKEHSKLIEQLNELPKIEDHQSKSVLYTKINQSMDDNKATRKRKYHKWFVPSIATIATAILIVLMIQTGVFNQEQSADHLMESQTNMRTIDDQEFDTISALEEEPEENSDEIESNDQDVDEDIVADQNEEAENDSGNRLVYYNDEYNLPIYNMAVTDQSAMYPIPVSLIDTAATGEGYPEDAYNRITNMIDAEVYGAVHFPFDEIEFSFSDDYQKIDMIVADDYQFPQGSALPYLFPKMINIMFADYPATEVNLQTESGDFIDLGPIGDQVSTLPIEPLENIAYKIYQFEDKERVLIALDQNISGEQFYTVDEALVEMQYDQPDYFVNSTIPSDAEFTVDPSGEELLRISFETNDSFGDNRSTKEMIEAILMTAKSFDFNQVEFAFADKLTSVDQFDLTEPITVPDGVNPLMLH